MYNRILDLKIASPQIIFNYGLFLEENNYFEEAFKVWLAMHLMYYNYALVCYFSCPCVCVCVCLSVCLHVYVCVSGSVTVHI